MLVSCSENHLHLLSRVDDFEFSLFFHKLLFLCSKGNLLFPYNETFVFILCSLLCRLGVCFLVCGIGSFFVLCPALPVPLVRCKSTLLPYRRGGCSPDAKQPKEQQEETALRTVFSSCPTGLWLKISRLIID